MIKARMRVGASWNDVCILNISPRGLSAQAAAPPAPGTYLEIRRDDHEIMARVIWARHHRFGVHTQDVLAIDDIINHPGRSGAPATVAACGAIPDRRKPRSSAQRHEDSRMLSRAIEFAVIGLFAATAAVAAFASITQAFQRPIAEASAALAPE